MHKLFYAPLFLLMAYICWGCSADRDDFNSLGNGKDTRLTFSVSLPAKANTYSLEATDENNVSSIYVLAFKYQNSQYELADWSETAESDIQDNGGSDKKKFTITFTRLKKDDSYKFVLLANAKEQIDALFQGGLTVGADKNTILQEVQLSGITHWNVDPTDPSYRDIPMWGETPSHDGTGDMAVSQDMSITGLKLLRMVARINVFVDGEGATPATSYFKLKSVDLYNTHSEGQVAPSMDNLVTGSMSKVETPTVVSGSNVTKGPTVYDGNMAGCTVSDAALNNTIYTFEAEVPRDGSDNALYEELTCLVIGGEFESDGKTTYYRVNLNKKESDGKVTYLDVLRNHTYNIKIVNVKGSGYDTSEEAFNAKAINMEAEVVDWDDGEVGEINESGGYRLALSPGSIFEFYRKGDPQTVNITTDYPGGWKVIKVTEEDKTTLIDQTSGWLKVDKPINAAQGKDGSKVPMTLTVDANDTGNDRKGYIYIQYANTKIYLSVTQLAEDVSIEVTSNGKVVNELLFTSMDETTPQTLDIKWTPKDGELAIVNSNISFYPFEGTGLPTTTTIAGGNGGTGSISYTITPTPCTDDEREKPFERLSKLDLAATDGVNYASASVLVRHLNYGLFADDIAPSYWLMDDDRTHTFKIKSSANWRIKSITEELESGSGALLDIQLGENLVVGAMGNANLSAGTPIKFTVAYNPSTARGTVKVVFESADTPKRFDDVEVTLNMLDEFYPKKHSGWAGSNIYWDGEKLTFDDVGDRTNEKYQGIPFQWGSLYGVAPSDGTTAIAWNESILLYPPEGGSRAAGTWDSWPNIVPKSLIFNVPKGKTVRDRAYLYEVTNASAGIGDICKHLTEKAGGRLHGKKWRMATANEFGAYADYIFSDDLGTVEYASTDPTGRLLINIGATKDGVFFPASKQRKSLGGNFSDTSSNCGYYWTSTPATPLDTPTHSNGYSLMYWEMFFKVGTQSTRATNSIRCVVKTE
ncbi:MAG TPA: hypothetical protein K8W04_03485 [Bacteroides reticulotermitis]|nr:hypothetical protein [Bacteroides reticulotermitis]